MNIIDWMVVSALLLLLVVMTQYTRKYSRSVVNFLAAGRCAGRYIIAVAEGYSGWGAISAIAAFEMYYTAGFSIRWWYFLILVAYIVISMSGWLTYRFRQTRSLTLSQYLEKRYSRRFRIFAGILGWTGGIINFGLFPAIGANFFVKFCGLPETFFLNGIGIPVFPLVVAFLLIISLYFIFVGGQISVIVTDFIQGLFCMIVFLVLMVYLYDKFTWTQVKEALSAAPSGQSMLNPFDSTRTDTFNPWYYILVSFGICYGWLSWQGTTGYRAAAKSPHEARMAMIVNNWRAISQEIIIILIPVCVFTFLNHPDFSEQAIAVKDRIADITGRTAIETATLTKQMTVPLGLSAILSKGIIGLFCAVMLAAFISTHDTYLHSWGTIFIQDVVMPFRRKPLSQKQHILLLKLSILGVAVFVFFFALFYRQNEYILMFFAFTGTIFGAGAGAVVIGGLYWKRGTSAGAWTSLIAGAVFAFTGAITRRVWPEFPLNSQWIMFIGSLTCITLYIVVSLIDGKVCDMDKMLNRGKYAIVDDDLKKNTPPVRGWRAIIAMGAEFTRLDKFIYIASLCWTLSLCAVFTVGTVINLIFDISVEKWADFWWIYIIIYFVLSIITTIWFLIGGIKDYREMFHLLKLRHADETDDGRVLK